MSTPVVAPDGRCLVDLHGKGGSGSPTVVDGDVAIVRPDGNGEGWGGREWRYFPDAQYRAAVASVEAGLDAAECSVAVLHGFSNGASFVASMYCAAERFDGRVVGFVVDDPVTDESAATCAGAAPDAVPVVLYWTGALEEQSRPGTSCADLDWTCEGGETIGVDAYAAGLATSVVASIHDDHRRYDDAPPVRGFVATGQFDPDA